MNRYFAVGLICLFSTSVFAENMPGAYTLTLADAYYHFDTKRQLDNASMPNIAVAYNFNEQWAAEGSVGVINTDPTQDNQPGVHGFLYMIDGIYRFKPHCNIEPYAVGGIGVLGLRPLQNGNEHQGNVNAGLGAQFFVDKFIALKTEFRDIYTMSGGKNDWLVNVGVSFLMDSASFKATGDK